MDQIPLFDDLEEGLNPAQKWDEDAAKRALDELFHNVRLYRSGKSYFELLNFISRFRFYSPFNAMLLHVQMPGARYVAPASRWFNRYGRFIKVEARPLVILQPMGPVMFVFDVSDTEPGPEARPLPKDVEKPFDPFTGPLGCVGSVYERTIENAKRDGIRITVCKEGSQSGGSIRGQKSALSEQLQFLIGKDRTGAEIFAHLPIRYEMLVNGNLSREARYATIVHELAHLYCGHLGTTNPKWWPDRRGLGLVIREFEAESTAYLLCARLRINIPADSYLSGYLSKNDGEIPPISLECVLKAASLIETMGREHMKLRKEKET